MPPTRRPRSASKEASAKEAAPRRQRSANRQAEPAAPPPPPLPPWAPSPIEYVWLDMLPGSPRSRASVSPWSGRNSQHARYAREQKLTVCINDAWIDASVAEPPESCNSAHTVELSNGKKELIFLSPWNHAPFDLSTTEFEELRDRYADSMGTEHAAVVDALSGRRLDINRAPLIKLVPVLDIEARMQAAHDPSKSPSCSLAARVLAAHQEDQWSDVQHLGQWLLEAAFAKPMLAQFVARVLELSTSYSAEAGSMPADAVTWLSNELKAFEPTLCTTLPAPWDQVITQSFERLANQLSGLAKTFGSSLDDLERRQQESLRNLDELQRREGQVRVASQRESKVSFEIEQKEQREERDAKLKEAVLELPGEKRDEHLRVGREEIAAEARLAQDTFLKRLEQEEQQFVAEQQGQRMTLEIAQRNDRNNCATTQRKEPFALLESELLAVLEELANAPMSMLITAEPAAGKSSLLSQLLGIVFNDEHTHALPILLKVHQLQRTLSDPQHAAIFQSAPNWVDAYLQIEHGANSERYRLMRQALASRRALLLIDGVDEGGTHRHAIEDHIVEVLAPQGYSMVVTSRPAGVHAKRFKEHFHWVQLCPLDREQQVEAVKSRVSDCAPLVQHVQAAVPSNPASGLQMTSNPLLLSLLVSIYESRKPSASRQTCLPQTAVELYESASRAMLERVSKDCSATARAHARGLPMAHATDSVDGHVLSTCSRILAAQKQCSPPQEWLPCKLGGAHKCGHPCKHLLQHLPPQARDQVQEAFARQHFRKPWRELSLEAQSRLKGKYLCPASPSCVKGLEAMLVNAGLVRNEHLPSHACNCGLCMAWRREKETKPSSSALQGEDYDRTMLLLRGAYFEAHMAQQRVVSKEHVLAAAVRLNDPRALAVIRHHTAMPVSLSPPMDGDWVEVTKGDYEGQCGRAVQSIEAGLFARGTGKRRLKRYAVRFGNGSLEAGLPLHHIVSSGMSREDCREWSRDRLLPALVQACEGLRIEVRDALHSVLEENGQVVDVLRVECEHSPHALQEYLAAKELCAGVRLWENPPWEWTSWWENTLALGTEIGDPFRRGLLRAAGVKGNFLNLRGKVGGDRAVSLKAVGQLLHVSASADLSQNALRSSGVASLAADIAASRVLNTLNLAENLIGSDGIRLLADAIAASTSLVTVDLRATHLAKEDEAQLRQVARDRRACAGKRRLTIFTDYGDSPQDALDALLA